MGVVVKFHARAATGSRAAKAVSRPAVSPASCPRSVASTAAHHSAGMPSRCHHLETAEALAPISAAIASRDGHSSMIDRNDVSAMQTAIRQLVLKSKDILSADPRSALGHTVRMNADAKSPTEFERQWIARTKFAREKSGKSQDEIAENLGIPQPTYGKYETRTVMPHRYVMAFCALCDVTPAWMYTAAVEIKVAKPRRRRQKQKAKAA